MLHQSLLLLLCWQAAGQEKLWLQVAVTVQQSFLGVTNINIYIPFFEHSRMSGVKATSSCRIPEHRVLREQPATAGVTTHHLQRKAHL